MYWVIELSILDFKGIILKENILFDLDAYFLFYFLCS